MRRIERSPGPPLLRSTPLQINRVPPQETTSPLLRPGVLGTPCPRVPKARKKPLCGSGRSYLPGMRGRPAIKARCRGSSADLAGPARRVTAAAGSNMSDWHTAAAAHGEQVLSRLKALAAQIAHIWKDRIYRFLSWKSKYLGACIILLLAVTALANMWGVPSLNKHVLPQARQTVSAALEREVDLGKVRWIAPTGLLGLTPVASIGPVRVGPSSLEGSSAVLPDVLVRLDPVQSLIHRKLMMQLRANKAQVNLNQNDNFSWFGYPDDTEPSCRNFVPGLKKVQKDGDSSPKPQQQPVLDLQAAARSPQAAKLAEKEQRRKLYPVPPDAAANFRPAVGKQLVELALQQSAAKKAQALESQALAKAGAKKPQDGTLSKEHAAAFSIPAEPVPSISVKQDQELEEPLQDVLESEANIAVLSSSSENSDKSDADQPSRESSMEEISTPGTDVSAPGLSEAPGGDSSGVGQDEHQPDTASLQREVEFAKPSKEVQALAEEPISLSLDTIADQAVTQRLADHSASVAAARPAMDDPTIDALHNLAGHNADFGLNPDQGCSKGGTEALDSFSNRGSREGRSDGLLPVHSLEAEQPGVERLPFTGFASLSAPQMGLPWSAAEAELPPELSDVAAFEAAPNSSVAPHKLLKAAKLDTSTGLGQTPTLESKLGLPETDTTLKEGLGCHTEAPQTVASKESSRESFYSYLWSYEAAVPVLLGMPSRDTGVNTAQSGRMEDVEGGTEQPVDFVEKQEDVQPELSLVEQRIQQSKTASTSGRDMEQQPKRYMQDRVRTHGGFREGQFARPAVRRTSRSYMRRRMPLSEQIQPTTTQGKAVRQALQSGAAQQGPPVSSNMLFTMEHAAPGAANPPHLLTSKGVEAEAADLSLRTANEPVGQAPHRHAAQQQTDLALAEDTTKAEASLEHESAHSTSHLSQPAIKHSHFFPPAQQNTSAELHHVAEMQNPYHASEEGEVVGEQHGRKARKARGRRRVARPPQLQMSARELLSHEGAEPQSTTKAARPRWRYARPEFDPPAASEEQPKGGPAFFHRGAAQARKAAAFLQEQLRHTSPRSDAAQEQAFGSKGQAWTSLPRMPQLPGSLPMIRWPSRELAGTRQQEHLGTHNSPEEKLVAKDEAVGPPHVRNHGAAHSHQEAQGPAEARQFRWERLQGARRLIKSRQEIAALRRLDDAARSASKSHSHMDFSLEHKPSKILNTDAGISETAQQLPGTLPSPDPTKLEFRSVAVSSLKSMQTSSAQQPDQQQHTLPTAPTDEQELAEPALTIGHETGISADTDIIASGLQPGKMIVEMAATLPDGPKAVIGTLTFGDSAEPKQSTEEVPSVPAAAPSSIDTGANGKMEQSASPRVTRQAASEPRLSKPKQRAHVSKRPRLSEEDTGPRYKPGTKSMLGSSGGVGSWISRYARPLLKHVKVPQVGIESVRIRGGDLKATLVGEPIPRQIDEVNLTVRLSNDYRSLTLDVTGNAHQRNSASNRCTMLSSDPVRHLRGAQSFPITRLPTDVPSSATLPDSSPRGGQHGAVSFRLGTSMSDLRDTLDHLAADAMNKAESSDSDFGSSTSDVQYIITNKEEANRRDQHWWGGRKSSRPQPTGGKIKARVVSKGLHLRYPDTRIRIWGRNLHAPMAERILELPIDVYGGTFNGEFKMHAYDAATWHLPLFGGRVRCQDLGFHFWDATDDFTGVDMDMLFEGNRLYLHGARGSFGAVPMTITGDMDLDPVTGQYRLTASVPEVEVNDLRKTLGIRPPPLPVGGALRGVLHCTGPLEQPVFSGTAVALPPTRGAVEAMEESNAKQTLLAEPTAAGAYDNVPFASASAIFTMDTSNDIFLLHSVQAEPLDGGQLIGTGRMWVNPIAEHDPRAVRVQMEGRGLPFEPLLLRYMPKGMHLPASLVLGEGSVHGTMQGSHMAPDIHAQWTLPTAFASGTADFSRETTRVTCQAPAIDVSAALHVLPPDFEAVKKAVTQAEVTALAQPVLDGLDLDANFKGLDMLPIVSPPEALEHINSSQPLRLKLNGRVKFSGSMDRQEKPSFAGDLSLDNLRVNQLKLTRNLTGSLSVAEDSFQVQAKGSRPDEALDVTVKLPLLDPEPMADTLQATRVQPAVKAMSGSFGMKLGDLLPIPGFGDSSKDSNPAESTQDGGGGHVSLRCGQLLMSAEVNGKASLVDCQVQGLKLDELELASLRGEVQEASLRLDLEARQGRGQVSVQGPRFSGLQGDSLSTAVRWERDVVRLERANLQQKNSRYEVQGEYVIPANVAIPRSAASMALATRDSDSPQNWHPFESSSGRWRIQVNVPTAQMEEILPAARLLSRATSPTPSDYERAKSAFLQGVHEASIQAQELRTQLQATAESARAQLSSTLASDEEAGPGGRSSKPGSRAALPGLQDLKGQWNGTFQAYGGGGGAANIDFNMRGQDWKWGDYFLDQAVAQGSCHSLEGVKIEELSLRTGEAKLISRGKVLTADQNASILLTDFPVALLQPLFRSLPALQNAAPAVRSGPYGNTASSGFSGLMPFSNRGAERSEASARPANLSAFANSPVNGLLYVKGVIGGSATVPEGELLVRLFDGAIGPTQLAQAQATASLDAAQRLKFGMDFEPAEPRSGGFARVTGSLPLRPAPAMPAKPSGQSSSAEGVASNAVEVSMHVKDGGMKLVRILTPDFSWQSGNADIELKLHGQPDGLALDGGMHLSKATITSPFLKYPMTNVAASVNLADNIVQVENIEAKAGRRGFVRVKGDLPMAISKRHLSPEFPRSSGRWNAVIMDIHDLELRLRNVYTGYLDASLQLRNSLAEPVLGGDVRLSRGTAMLVPQGTALDADKASEPPKEDDLVQKAFTVLTRKEGLAKQLGKPQDGRTSPAEGMPSLQLQGLQVRLGPELRAMYPVVVNMGISGNIEINGPAEPSQLRLTGTVNLESGEINLVAAQLVLDREHANRLVFDGQEGLDPVVDLSLKGAQIRALVQGHASTWHRHMVLTPITAPVGEAAEQLQPSEAARIFEGQLASALVAEDGQLALSNLAVSAAHGFMPRIQTQGQLGQARWRLVSAPSIPGLLSLDPTGDPTSLLSSLTMGTEVEVQFGNSLQAAMARKLRDSDIATQWTLNYQLNSKLRMQFTIASVHPYPRTLLFQYSGDST